MLKKSKFPFELENQEKVWKTIKIVTHYIKMLQLSLHQNIIKTYDKNFSTEIFFLEANKKKLCVKYMYTYTFYI